MECLLLQPRRHKKIPAECWRAKKITCKRILEEKNVIVNQGVEKKKNSWLDQITQTPHPPSSPSQKSNGRPLMARARRVGVGGGGGGGGRLIKFKRADLALHTHKYIYTRRSTFSFSFILEGTVTARMDFDGLKKGIQVTCSGITSSQQSTYECIKRLKLYKEKSELHIVYTLLCLPQAWRWPWQKNLTISIIINTSVVTKSNNLPVGWF